LIATGKGQDCSQLSDMVHDQYLLQFQDLGELSIADAVAEGVVAMIVGGLEVELSLPLLCPRSTRRRLNSRWESFPGPAQRSMPY